MAQYTNALDWAAEGDGGPTEGSALPANGAPTTATGDTLTIAHNAGAGRALYVDRDDPIRGTGQIRVGIDVTAANPQAMAYVTASNGYSAGTVTGRVYFCMGLLAGMAAPLGIGGVSGGTGQVHVLGVEVTPDGRAQARMRATNVQSAAGLIVPGEIYRAEWAVTVPPDTGAEHHTVAVYSGHSTTPLWTADDDNVTRGTTLSLRTCIGMIGTHNHTTSGAREYWLDEVLLGVDEPHALPGPVTRTVSETARPDGTPVLGGWETTGPARGSWKATSDEDPATFVSSPGEGFDEAITLSLSPLAPGVPTLGVLVRAPEGVTDMRLEVLEGDTVRAERTQEVTSTSFQSVSFELTQGEASSIGNRSNLRLRITGNPT